MRTFLKSGTLIAGILALTACTSTQNSAPTPVPQLTPAPKPVENSSPKVASLADINGTWQQIDATGKELGSRSAFKNGQFASYDRERTSSDELLAKGTYRASSIEKIDINFRGVVSGPNSATCQLQSRSRMNCVLKSGAPFYFKKVSGKA